MRMVCTFCHTVQSAPDVSETVDRVLPLRAPLGVHCPVCDAELEASLVDEVSACHCPNCRGLLFSSTEFRKVVEDRRAAYAGPDIAVALPHPIELERRLACPSCHQPMEVHPYYGAGRAIIDSCAECQLVWVDLGELTGLERSPGRRSPAMMEVQHLVKGVQEKVTGDYSAESKPVTALANPLRGIGLLEIVGMLLG
jgi:Zn-finger nucleic acid-binding protein